MTRTPILLTLPPLPQPTPPHLWVFPGNLGVSEKNNLLSSMGNNLDNVKCFSYVWSKQFSNAQASC